MRLIILAAPGDDGLDWLDRYLNTPDVQRTVRVPDVHAHRATIIDFGHYDRLASVLDPNSIEWLTECTTKIVRTDHWPFDQRVINALRVLHARHRLCDPTGLLGPNDDEISARRGWASDGRTAPMGIMAQRNKERPKARANPRRAIPAGA